MHAFVVGRIVEVTHDKDMGSKAAAAERVAETFQCAGSVEPVGFAFLFSAVTGGKVADENIQRVAGGYLSPDMEDIP